MIYEPLGVGHPLTLASGHSVSFLYGKMARHDEAIALSKNIAKTSTDFLGVDNPESRSYQFAVVTRYVQANRHRAGIAAAKQILARTKRVFGDDHPNTAEAAKVLEAARVLAHK